MQLDRRMEMLTSFRLTERCILFVVKVAKLPTLPRQHLTKVDDRSSWRRHFTDSSSIECGDSSRNMRNAKNIGCLAVEVERHPTKPSNSTRKHVEPIQVVANAQFPKQRCCGRDRSVGNASDLSAVVVLLSSFDRQQLSIHLQLSHGQQGQRRSAIYQTRVGQQYQAACPVRGIEANHFKS